MGSTFANVQILAPETLAPARIAEVLEARLLSAGWIAAEPGEHERELAVGPRSAAGWITVWDDLSDNMHRAPLDELASTVSAECEATTVAVQVFDSDTVLLELYAAGRSVDALERTANYDGTDRDADPEAWVRQLGRGDADALRAAWADEPVFAEDTVAQTAAQLGWDGSALVGWTYMQDSPPPELVKLHLRRAGAREAAQDDSRPMGFVHYPMLHRADVFSGEVGGVTIAVQSAGGTGTGLAVRWAFTEGADLVVPEQAVVSVMGNVLNPRAVPRPLQATFEPDGGGFVARLPEVVIPAGPALEEGEAPEAVEQKLASAPTIHVSVRCRGVAPGVARAEVTFPREDAPKGGLAIQAEVTVKAAARRPKKAAAGTPGHMLEQLAARVGVSAVLLLDDDASPDEGPGRLVELVKDWLEQVAPDQTLQAQVASARRPTDFTVGQWSDKAFRRIEKAIEGGKTVHTIALPSCEAEWEGPAVDFEIDPDDPESARAALEAMSQTALRIPERTVEAGFSVCPKDNLGQPNPARLALTAPRGDDPEARRAQLVEIVDRAVQAGYVTQAYLTEDLLMMSQTNLCYEHICEGGQGFLPDEVARTRLVAVYETMWVGAGLAPSVRAAGLPKEWVRSIGEGLRLQLPDVDQAEARLDELLLGANDYRELWASRQP